MNSFKKFRVAALALLMTFALSLTVAAKSSKTVERGMTKAQVVSVYGKPMATSFDENGEKWSYKKTRGGMLTPYDVSIMVEFDADGKVVRCNEQISENRQSVEVTQTSTTNAGVRPVYGSRRHAPLSDGDFNVLLSKVKSASFNDRKLDLIQVACFGCWLTCRQGASLVAVFSFTDGKMKALRFIAPRLVDLQNTNEIYRQFTFSSDKDKAAEIISKSQR